MYRPLLFPLPSPPSTLHPIIAQIHARSSFRQVVVLTSRICFVVTEEPDPDAEASGMDLDEKLPTPPPPLRPLTSLKWPYVPEESAYPDPLKRDDPKTLQVHQYEAIGMLYA